jgi:SAM-dependent methyltransferase
METRNVYLYWIGKEYKLISILRNLMYLHSTNGKGYKINLITDKNINEYLEDIPHYFSKLCPAHQADYIRVNVICDRGGIWLDSDTLVLDSLDSLFDYIDNQNGFFITQNNEILWNGIFGSKPNTPLMVEWKTEMKKILDSKNGNIGWCDIGNDLLQRLYNKQRGLYDDYHIFNGLNNLYPVNWNNCVTEFIDKPYDNYKTIIREYQPLIVLVNSVYKKLENKTEKEILDGNTPINYFINKSFENNRKIIYLKIAKNMGTLMTQILSTQIHYYGENYFAEDYINDKLYTSKIITLGHGSNIKEFKKKYKQIFECADKIIIVRNPNDRFVSGYNYCKLNEKYEYYLKNSDVKIIRDNKKLYDHNWVHVVNTQVDAIDYDANIYHDKSFHWINMDDPFKINKVFSKLGLSLSTRKLPIINSSNTNNNILNEDEKKLIHNVFEEDFKLYNYLVNNTNKSVFENIYEKSLWNNGDANVPLSGPGSSLENTKEYSTRLTKFIYDNECKSVLDLGCGDLTWIPQTQFFNDNGIKYTGVDVVESLIVSHRTKFPEKHFLCKDITSYRDIDDVDIIIIRDVIFHLTNDEILSIFDNIKNKFQFIIITNCRNSVNKDNFDRWHFSEKNIHIEPFNKSQNVLMQMNEPVFNRNVLIYSHNSFY